MLEFSHSSDKRLEVVGVTRQISTLNGINTSVTVEDCLWGVLPMEVQ